MRTLMGINHEVKDFDAWRAAYDGVREMQHAGGVRFQQVLRMPAEPNRVYVTHVFDTREEAEAFAANPELKAAMENAGVIESSVKIMFFDEVEAGEV